MISSVKDREKYATNFLDCYKKICELLNVTPLRKFIKNIQKHIIDTNVDSIRYADWQPLLKSLEINKNIRFIRLRSLTFNRADEKEVYSVLKKQTNALNTPELLSTICRSLSSCLTVNTEIILLELQNLPLLFKDVNNICKGVTQTTCLQLISFENCPIGDEGLTCICRYLPNLATVSSLNLSGCGISAEGIPSLVKLIKIQASQRQANAWQESLRYRTPNLDTLGGLRRLTLNGNPGIGNSGSILLSNALADDMWMKAIDMQNCDLGDAAALAWLALLSPNQNASFFSSGNMPMPTENKTLNVLDLRRNKAIDRQLLRTVTERVLVNSNGKQTRYNWLTTRRKAEGDSDTALSSEWPGIVGIDIPQESSSYEANRVVCHNPDYQPKPMPKSKRIVRPVFKPGGGKFRCRPPAVRTFANHNRSRVSVRSNRSRATTTLISSALSLREAGYSIGNGSNESNRSIINHGIPWRAAARAVRYQGEDIEQYSDYNNPHTSVRPRKLIINNFVKTNLHHERPPIKQPLPRGTGKSMSDGSSHVSISQLERDICKADNSMASTYREDASLKSATVVAPSGGRIQKKVSPMTPVNPEKDKQLLQELWNTSRVHDKQLKSQIKKHLKKISQLEIKLKKEKQHRLECEISYQQSITPRNAEASKPDVVLNDIFTRLDITLTEIERLLRELADPNRPNQSDMRNQALQLRLIQSALRKMTVSLTETKSSQGIPTRSSRPSNDQNVAKSKKCLHPPRKPLIRYHQQQQQQQQADHKTHSRKREACGDSGKIEYDVVASTPKKPSVPFMVTPKSNISSMQENLGREEFIANVVSEDIPKASTRLRYPTLIDTPAEKTLTLSTKVTTTKDENRKAMINEDTAYTGDSRGSLFRYVSVNSVGFVPNCSPQGAGGESRDKDQTSYACPAEFHTESFLNETISGPMPYEVLKGISGLSQPRPSTSPFLPSSVSLRQYGNFEDLQETTNSIHTNTSYAERKYAATQKVQAWKRGSLQSTPILSSDYDDIFDGISQEFMLTNTMICPSENISNQSDFSKESDFRMCESFNYKQEDKRKETDDDEFLSDC